MFKIFEASLADPKLLKYSIDAISTMIEEAGAKVGKDGIRIQAMDPSHVALVDFELKKEAFEKFAVKEPLVLGLDLDRFNTILKRAGANDKIFLAFDRESNALQIKFQNSSTRTFNLPLIEVSEEELKVPNLKFPCAVEISPSIIDEGVKDAEVVSDHVTLKMDSDFLYIVAKGELGNVEVKISKDETINFQFNAKEPCKSMFSTEYLRDMIKAGAIANSIKISLGENIPVKIDFLTAGANLSFLLAPRIESE